MVFIEEKSCVFKSARPAAAALFPTQSLNVDSVHWDFFFAMIPRAFTEHMIEIGFAGFDAVK